MRRRYRRRPREPRAHIDIKQCQPRLPAEEYQRRLAVIVSTIGKVIEPMVLIIAGVMFAVIISGLFLPIFDLIAQVA